MAAHPHRHIHLIAGAGIALLLIVGIIHFIDAPSSFGDATYKGLLFIADGLAAGVAAWGIYRSARTWGWSLGFIITAGAFIMYIYSRTIGLPGIDVDTWDEPLGTLSLIAEGMFMLLYVAAMRLGVEEVKLSLEIS